MKDLVLAASVLVKWFHSGGEAHVEVAHALRREFESGRLEVLVPPLIEIELLNVARRRWQWPSERLTKLATGLTRLSFSRIDPDIAVIAGWCAQGLTAYDATYVAVAEITGATLITGDVEITKVADEHAMLLEDYRADGGGSVEGLGSVGL